MRRPRRPCAATWASFCLDPRVVELPAALWQLILRLFVLTRRPAAIAPKYAQVWLDRGSPLLVHSQDLADAVAASLRGRGLDVRVGLGMRYGRPALADALVCRAPPAAAVSWRCRCIHSTPPAPRPRPSMRWPRTRPGCVTSPPCASWTAFRQSDAYVDALYRSVRAHWDRAGTPPTGCCSAFMACPSSWCARVIPISAIASRPRRALRARLGADGARHVAFQSRFGRRPGCSPIPKPHWKPGAGKGSARWI